VNKISSYILQKYTKELIQEANIFDCKNSDLNEFFEKDAFSFETQLFGKTYCFLKNSNPKEIVDGVTNKLICFFMLILSPIYGNF
jgi:hypothetical protein